MASVLHVSLLGLVAIFIGGAPALATSLSEDISQAERRSATYFQKAKARDGHDSLGNAWVYYHRAEHTCAILGKILGKRQFTRHLEMSYPAISSTNSSALRGAGHSLGNWAQVAGRINEMNRGERIAVWNLDCVNQFNIPSTAVINEVSTFFEVRRSPFLYLIDEAPRKQQRI